MLRHAVFRLAILAAGVAVAAQVVEGPPGSGYGWGSVVLGSVLLAAPLVGIALAVRSSSRRVAGPVVAVAGLLCVVVLMALVGNWEGHSPTSRALDVVVAVLVLGTCVGAVLLEFPMRRRQSP